MESYMLFETDTMINSYDSIIYYAKDIQALFKVNKINGETRLLWKNFHKEFFDSFVFYNNKYIFFPYGADNGGILDLEQKSFKYLNIPKNLHLPNEYNWASCYIRYKNLLLFCGPSPVITQYNLETNEWKIYRDWQKQLPSNVSLEWMTGDAFLHNERLYVPMDKLKYLLEIDFKNNKTHIYYLKLPSNIIEISMCYYFQNELFLLCKNNNNKISILKSDLFLIKHFEEIINSNHIIDNFNSIVLGKEYLWLFPLLDDKACKINLKTGESEICFEIPTYDKLPFKYNYGCGLLKKNFYWTINIHTGELVELNRLNDNIRTIKMSFSILDYKKIMLKTMFSHETSIDDFEKWLYIVAADIEENKYKGYIPENFLLENSYNNKKSYKSNYNSLSDKNYAIKYKNKRKWDSLFF